MSEKRLGETFEGDLDKVEDLDKTVERVWNTIGADADTIELRPGSTIEPTLLAGSNAPALVESVALAGGLEKRLRIEGTLGQGGMGLVHLATQLSIGRKVAVKTLRGEKRDDERCALALLREAWITGAVEHPNVVPVHDIGADGNGTPFIVLKRIEGTHWGELIGDGAQIRERSGSDDPLEWNLRTLMQVCHAVSFAHRQGILHRDLKPENVMIGEFGEIYLVDWGIAVATRDDGSNRFPLASAATEMAGTPYYMAPEMLGEAEPRLSERTDVYLLGSILYEVLTGHPPHERERARDVIRSVLRSRPELPADAPAELARTCRRAMAPDPADRYESARQLREELQGFLQHRGSTLLARRAEGDLALLLELLGSGGAAEQRARLYGLLGQCRFGFRAALKEWSGCDTAREGLDRAVEAMVDYELEQGDPRAAATLLSEIEAPSPELRGRVDAALRAAEEERRQTEAFARVGRQFDPEVGQRTRIFLGVLLGVIWTLTPLLGAIFMQGTSWESYGTLTSASLVLIVVFVGLGVWARESIMKTALNRRLAASVMFMLLAQLLLFFVGARFGVSPAHAVVYTLFIWFATAAFVAISLEWRLFPSALSHLAALVLSVLWLDGRYYFMSASDLVLTINIAVIWWPRELAAPCDRGRDELADSRDEA